MPLSLHRLCYSVRQECCTLLEKECCHGVVDNWPPHTRDFSRELGAFLLHFVCTYGIILIWIKALYHIYFLMLRMVADMSTLCNIISCL